MQWKLSLAMTGGLLILLASDAQAGRRGYRYPVGGQTIYQPAYQPAVQPSPSTDGQASVQSTSNYKAADAPNGNDALAEVNALRASRGLRPYVYDAGLTQAAGACATFRAQNRIAGHTSNDFAFVPAGSVARSGGCAAWPPSMGWGSCCTFDGYTYAGAAWCLGADGQRYMSLFVR